MTLAKGVWAVDEQTIPAVVARLQLQAATRNGNGVLSPSAMVVRPLDVPGQGVLISDGAGVALGREAADQGSYFVRNIGDAQVSLTATGSSGPRSDLIYVRVEDPTVDGTPWSWNPETDQLVYFRVWEGCPASTEDVPEGETGIPLARLDRPASTGPVTGSHIVQLAPKLDPRSLTDQLTMVGSWEIPDSVGNTTEWEQWPSGAEWELDVPTWATQIVVSYRMDGVQYRRTGGPGGSGADAQGYTRANFGGTGMQTVRHWVRGVSGDAGTRDYTRMSVGGGDTMDIPASWRGTTKVLKLQGAAIAGTGTGKIEADGGSMVTVTYTFRESARNDVPDYRPA